MKCDYGHREMFDNFEKFKVHFNCKLSGYSWMGQNYWNRLFASVPKKMAKFILVHTIKYVYEDLLRHIMCLS